MISAILLVVIAISLIIIFAQNGKSAKLPGPSALLLTYYIIKCKGSPHKLFDLLHEVYGQTFQIQFKPFRPMVFTSNAECVQKILSRDGLERIFTGRIFKSYFGQGIVTATPVAQWKIDRQVMNHAMGREFLTQFLSKTQHHIDKLCDKITREELNKPIDVQSYTTRAFLDSIIDTLAGTIQIDQELVNAYSRARNRFISLLEQRVASVYLLSEPIHSFSKNYEETVESCKVLREFATDVLKMHRQIPKDQIHPQNFIQVLIDGGMNDDTIIDNINTLIEAGHITTSSTTAWILYELSKNKSIQDKILQETVEVLGNDLSSNITSHEIKNLKYIDCFVNEILRYYTIVSYVTRKLGKPLIVDGVELPVGTIATASACIMHMDPRYYDNPKEFNPDRWLPDNREKLNPNAYIPFAAGLRNCIAKTVATYQLKLVVALLVRTFEIEHWGGHVPDVFDVPARISRNGVYVILTRRGKKV